MRLGGDARGMPPTCCIITHKNTTASGACQHCCRAIATRTCCCDLVLCFDCEQMHTHTQKDTVRHAINLLGQVQCNLEGFTSNDAFHFLHDSAAMVEDEMTMLLSKRAKASAQIAELEARLAAARRRFDIASERLPQVEAMQAQVSGLQEQLGSRRGFRGDLPNVVMVSIMGILSSSRRCAAAVCRAWYSGIQMANKLGMFSSKVLCVSAGRGNYQQGHTIVCTKNGLFTFGSGKHGRLGHGTNNDEQTPRRVEALRSKKVVMSSAGYGHTVVCSKDGKVFTFGFGQHGALGHSDLQPKDEKGNEAICSLVPRLVDTLASRKVISIAAGANHTVLCTDAGEVFTFGQGSQGQLGHGHDGLSSLGNDALAQPKPEWSPRAVQALVGIKVVRVAAGVNYSIVCTHLGALWSFGGNVNGQLGHGTNGRELLPRAIEALAGKVVVGVSAGTGHTSSWTAQGELFTWGAAVRLGAWEGGMAVCDPTPFPVQALAGKVVVGAHCGIADIGDTAAWTDKGELYTFGGGSHGQLGHGTTDAEVTPRLVQALVGKKVVQASLGCHSVVFTEDGEVYTFGCGSKGALGHGDCSEKLLPSLVEALMF